MMMGGRTKIGMGSTTRVKAVSMIAWGTRREHCAHASFQTLQWVGFNFPFHEIRCVRVTAAEQEVMHFHIIGRHHICHSVKKCVNIFGAVESQVCKLTCLAAIFEDPTTFPLSSSTSIPSDSSLCLIRPTLQMFALAEDGRDFIM